MNDRNSNFIGGARPPMRISHTHESIINWLVLNPEKSLRECADYFQYTQSWISTLIHSDIFQMALRERQQSVAARVAQSIPEKLRACADVALDKLGDQIAASEDPDFILDAADRVLHRMGFAPQSARNPAGSPSQGAALNVQNNLYITAGDLQDARAILQGVSEVVPAIPALCKS